MSKAKTKMQQMAITLCLGSALLMAACGGWRGANVPSGTGGDSGSAQEAPTRGALPTMPSARFAAPTTMITPQSDQAEAASSEETPEAPEEAGASNEITATEEMTSTVEITGTEEMTDTQ